MSSMIEQGEADCHLTSKSSMMRDTDDSERGRNDRHEQRKGSLPTTDKMVGKSSTTHGPSKGSSSVAPRSTQPLLAKTALQERLQEIVVFELTDDGGREYKTMTLRGLYDYAMKAITMPFKVAASTSAVAEGGGDFPSTSTSDRHLSASAPSSFSSSRRTLSGREKSTSGRTDTSHVGTQQRAPNQNTGPGKHGADGHVGYRGRLGGYLHPRDMRRLVTPFSVSNESELIVRRHVMLLNFDPLRAIVLRDRLLVLIPDGSDSILVSLERRVRGGITEFEKQVYGDTVSTHDPEPARQSSAPNLVPDSSDDSTLPSHAFPPNEDGNSSVKLDDCNIVGSENVEVYDERDCDDEDGGGGPAELVQDLVFDDEWEDMEGKDWIDMPFELQCADAVLESVSTILAEDVTHLRERVLQVMCQFRSESANSSPGDYVQEKLRLLKDGVKETESRVQGFVRAMNLLLDDDEDMALMNLSRLISHPERFLQPVSQHILNEESDEPELILEAYLQQALCLVNSLALLRSNIDNTEELVSMQMDVIGNRILYINTVVSAIALCVTLAAVIGSFYGMNLTIPLAKDSKAFTKVVVGTNGGAFVLFLVLMRLFRLAGIVPVFRNPLKKHRPRPTAEYGTRLPTRRILTSKTDIDID